MANTHSQLLFKCVPLVHISAGDVILGSLEAEGGAVEVLFSAAVPPPTVSLGVSSDHVAGR